MKLPRTSVIVASLTAATASVFAWATGAYHWTDVQTGAASGAAVATIVLAGFVVEHLRKETASRWVGVLGLIPADLVSIAALGTAFAWWTSSSASRVTTLAVSGVTTLASLLGVTIAQGKVYSPETNAKELEATAVEVAAAKNVDPAVHAR